MQRLAKLTAFNTGQPVTDIVGIVCCINTVIQFVCLQSAQLVISVFPQAGRKDCYRIGGSLVSGVTNGHKYRYNVPSMNTRTIRMGVKDGQRTSLKGVLSGVCIHASIDTA